MRFRRTGPGRCRRAPTEELELEEESTLELGSGIYYFESIEAEENVTIALDLASGPIIINVVDEVEFESDIVMTVTGGSVEEVIGEDVELGEDGQYLGTFLARHGKIELGNGSTLTGSLYAESVEIKNSAVVTAFPALDLLIDASLDWNGRFVCTRQDGDDDDDDDD